MAQGEAITARDIVRTFDEGWREPLLDGLSTASVRDAIGELRAMRLKRLVEDAGLITTHQSGEFEPGLSKKSENGLFMVPMTTGHPENFAVRNFGLGKLVGQSKYAALHISDRTMPGVDVIGVPVDTPLATEPETRMALMAHEARHAEQLRLCGGVRPQGAQMGTQLEGQAYSTQRKAFGAISGIDVLPLADRFRQDPEGSFWPGVDTDQLPDPQMVGSVARAVGLLDRHGYDPMSAAQPPNALVADYVRYEYVFQS